MARTALDRAEKLFASGRFAELISLLEPQVPVYRESQRFYYLLGASCLRVGDPGGASTYLKRAEQLSPSNVDTILALAALSVRKGEIERAIEGYLRVLEDKPGNRRARAGLGVLRKEGGPEGLAHLIESGRIERLYPGHRPIPRFVPPLGIFLVFAAAVYFGWSPAAALLEAVVRPRAIRPEVAAVTLSRAETDSPVQTGGTFRYVLTEKQALDTFEKAKDYFQAYRDNAALIEINRLLGSNARAGLKEKARSLRSFVGKPDFRTIKDVPAFDEVRLDPALFDGCSVSWKGMAANVKDDSGVVTFDFLVGYQDKNRLEGIVPGRISGAEVPVDRPLELLARLSFADKVLSLDGIAIHELVPGKTP